METNTRNHGRIIGGTIAVPDDDEDYLEMNRSSNCSDLTLDLVHSPHPRAHRPSLSFGGVPLSPAPRRPFRQDALRAATPARHVAVSAPFDESDDSFYTTAAPRASQVCAGDGGEEEAPDDESASDADLDAVAERAAIACFGADAEAVPKIPRRKSVLVSENSVIDVSWFASRGLMSRRSFERYQEEMKSGVIQGASFSSKNLTSLGRGGRGASRRASISMGDLRNKSWRKPKDSGRTSAEVAESNGDWPRKTKSVEEGLDGLLKSGSVDRLVQSIVSAMKPEEARRSDEHASSTPSNNNLQGKDSATAHLSSNELRVLTNMMRRLSGEGTRPRRNDVDAGDACVQGDIVTDRTAPRNRPDDDLVDSGTWEKSPHHLPERYDSLGSDALWDEADEAAPVRPAVEAAVSEERKTTAGAPAFGKTTLARSDTGMSSITHGDVATRREFGGSGDDLSGSFTWEGSARRDDDAKYSPRDCSSVDKSTAERRGSASTDGAVATTEDQVEVKAPARTDCAVDLRRCDRSKQSHSRSMTYKANTEPNIRDPALGKTTFARSDTGMSSITHGDVATRRDSSGSGDDLRSASTDGAVAVMRNQVEVKTLARTDCAVDLGRFDRSEQSHSRSMTYKSNTEPNIRDARRHSTVTPSSGDDSLMRRKSWSDSLGYTPRDVDTLAGKPLKQDCGDILQEGQEHLSSVFLVNVYSKLRELSMLGHASVKLVDIDVNSHQSFGRRKERIRLGLESEGDVPYLEHTKTAGAIVRTVLDEYEMFQASNELRAPFSRVNETAMAYDASLLSEFQQWVEESKVKQLDRATEEVIDTLRKQCAERQLLLRERSSGNLIPATAPTEVRGVIRRRRCSLNESSDSFQRAPWLKQERTLIADHFGIKKDIPSSDSRGDIRGPRRKMSDEVLTKSMIETTLENTHDYFQEGSSLRNLLQAGLEVVWFSDRHPSDIIYCICVNRDTATVTVVFRGEEGFVDLIKDSSMSEYSNPIVGEDYEGNSEFINLRSAVSDELMRVRRDNNKSTVDEIRDKVEKVGKELTNNGRYHLSITGHNLGGGLATVVGFCLAADPSLELASAVRVFTFASSRVGCRAFQQSFRHLENTGRLQHARFTNSNESVPLLPMQNTYHHTGIQINLHKSNRAGRRRTRLCLDVSYNSSSRSRRLGEIIHFVLNCISAFKSSRISEFQHRMHFAREYRLALGNGVLRFDKRRKHLKSLNDYYLMKCRFGDDIGVIKKQESIPLFFLFFFVSCLVSFEMALLFKFIATW